MQAVSGDRQPPGLASRMALDNSESRTSEEPFRARGACPVALYPLSSHLGGDHRSSTDTEVGCSETREECLRTLFGTTMGPIRACQVQSSQGPVTPNQSETGRPLQLQNGSEAAASISGVILNLV